MKLPQFDDLPFNSRPDLTPYLIHLTKNTKAEDEYNALENLTSILKSGEIWGSDTSKGFVKGPHTAACFMDVPFQALKYVLTPENADPQKPRYEPYGIVVTKRYGYDHGCRPDLYLSNDETGRLCIPTDELWRVVRFEVTEEGWISWQHEREWRCKGNFRLPAETLAVLVKTTAEAAQLTEWLVGDPEYKCKPRSVIPLNVICQGLLR
ncbi:MAG: hypothetical protein WBL65_02710 [Bryobacteraceae bacterium]